MTRATKRTPTPHSGQVFPGWHFKPVAKEYRGLLVTTEHTGQPHPKPTVHIHAGKGATLCGISTRQAPQGHRTYGLNFMAVATMPAPRKGHAFSLCARCKGAQAEPEPVAAEVA